METNMGRGRSSRRSRRGGRKRIDEKGRENVMGGGEGEGRGEGGEGERQAREDPKVQW